MNPAASSSKGSHRLTRQHVALLWLALALVVVCNLNSAAARGDTGVAGQGVQGLRPALLVPSPRIVRGPYLQSLTTCSIIVRWRTDLPSDSRVQFGPTPDALMKEVLDSELTTEHIVTLTNLTADTRYFYAIGTSVTRLAGGADHFFVTAPATAKPTRIWAIGDSGTANQPDSLVYARDPERVRDAYYNFANGRSTDVWLMLGDNAYYDGTDSDYQTNVFDFYPELLRCTPVWSTIGNHDARFTAEFPYQDIFSLPRNGEAGGLPSGSENYYSFNYGQIHFVCLDSEVSDRRAGAPMFTWLEQDLAANTNDWLIAFWHSPPYTKGSHNSDSPFDSAGSLVHMRERALPILENYGVDLVLCGHSHSYERSYLLDGHYGYSTSLASEMIQDAGSGRPEDTGAYRKSSSGPRAHQGTIYVVAGNGGWVYGGPLNHPAMFISLNRLGSLVIDVAGPRLDLKFLRETGAIDDHFTLLKGAPPEPLRFATVRVQQGVVTAKWKSVAGHVYRIQTTPRLEEASWTDASSEIIATGATTTWTGTVSANAPACFYRVVQIEP